LKVEVQKHFQVLKKQDYDGKFIRNNKHAHELKKKLKRKAMGKAIMELRKLQAHG
jgi:hypothetical protein